MALTSKKLSELDSLEGLAETVFPPGLPERRTPKLAKELSTTKLITCNSYMVLGVIFAYVVST